MYILYNASKRTVADSLKMVIQGWNISDLYEEKLFRVILPKKKHIRILQTNWPYISISPLTYTGWPAKHGRIFLVLCKTLLVQCTPLYTCTMDKSHLPTSQKNTAIFNWSPCDPVPKKTIDMLNLNLIWEESWPVEDVAGGEETGNVGDQLRPAPTVYLGILSKRKKGWGKKLSALS